MGLLQRLGKGKMKQKMKTTNNNNNNNLKKLKKGKKKKHQLIEQGKKLIDNVEDLTSVYREGIKKKSLMRHGDQTQGK